MLLQVRPRTLLIATIMLLGADLAVFTVALRSRPQPDGGIGMSGASYEYYDDGSIVIRPHSPPRDPPLFRPYQSRPPTLRSQVRRWGPTSVLAGITIALGLIWVISVSRRRDLHLLTLLAATALLAPPLAYASYFGLAIFRNYHAALANQYWYDARMARHLTRPFEQRGDAAGARRAEELQRLADEFLHGEGRHEFWSGRSLDQVSTR